MNKTRYFAKALKYYGLSRFLFRLKYELFLKSGLLEKKFPAYKWSQKPLESWLEKEVLSVPAEYKQWRINIGSSRFFFNSSDFANFELPEQNKTIATADDILAGKINYFWLSSNKVGNISFKSSL